jgi:hypothetical protein
MLFHGSIDRRPKNRNKAIICIRTLHFSYYICSLHPSTLCLNTLEGKRTTPRHISTRRATQSELPHYHGEGMPSVELGMLRLE